MTFKLLGNRIAIEVLPEQERIRASGLIIPAGVSTDFTRRGKIVALGTEILKKNEASVLQVGQVIIYIKDWKHEIEADGQTLTIINEEEIVAIIE